MKVSVDVANKMSGGQQEISCTESCESSAAAEVTNSYVSINL